MVKTGTSGRGSKKGLRPDFGRLSETISDGRQIFQEALGMAPEEERKILRERIARADGKIQALIEPAGKCLWGSEVAEAEGWHPEKNWWYFSRPKKGDVDFLAEIDDI